MFHLRRFPGKRGRAALALLPAVVMMFATGLAAAQTAPAPTEVSETEAAISGARSDSTVKLRASRHVMAGRKAKLRGRVRPSGRRWVIVRVGGRKVKTVRTRKDGTFSVRWRAPRAGVFKAKAFVGGTERQKRARSRTRQINAYRAAHASYYGPGLYGNGTACGQTLTPSTVGVANKTLPCGTKVTFRHRGRTVQARVIDRGPYAAGREWDLTAALKAKLGFGSTGVVLSTK
ncbi:MAG: hypothetical protein FJW90_03475 [Actinobacteria bacterium]|nr:hypothetical protein [Actinomycetota bacterium]